MQMLRNWLCILKIRLIFLVFKPKMYKNRGREIKQIFAFIVKGVLSWKLLYYVIEIILTQLYFKTKFVKKFKTFMEKRGNNSFIKPMKM